MKKIFCILVLILLASFVFAEEDVYEYDLDIDCNSFILLNDTVEASITLTKFNEPLPYQNITYTFTSDDGLTLYNFGQARTDKNGSANVTFRLPSYVKAGNYNLQFSHERIIARMQVIVEDNNFSLRIKDYFITPDKTLRIDGTNKSGETSFPIRILDVKNNEIASYDVPLNHNKFKMTLEKPASQGTYYLEVQEESTTVYYSFIITDKKFKIINKDSYTFEYGQQAKLPTELLMKYEDGTEEYLPVEWDTSTHNPVVAGTYYVGGVLDDKFYVSTHVITKPRVNNDDDDDKDDNEDVEVIEDLVPEAGFKTEKDKKEAMDKVNNKFKKLGSHPTAKAIKDLEKDVTAMMKAVNKAEAKQLTKDMKAVIRGNLKSLSKADAKEMIVNLINSADDSYVKEMTTSERVAHENEMKQLVNDLLKSKNVVQTTRATKQQISIAIENSQAYYEEMKQSIQDENVLDDFKLYLESESTLSFDKEALQLLDEQSVDVVAVLAEASFEVPVSELNGLQIQATATNAVTSKKTDNGSVTPIKTFDFEVSEDGQSLENITVRLPLGDLDMNGLMVGLYENGEWIKMDYTIEDGEIVFTAPHFSVYGLMTYEASFTDIEHWAKPYITSLASKGIVSGKTETLFDTEGTITRAEFVTMIINHLGLTEQSTENFNDEADWFSPYLSIAKDYGLSYGADNNYFRGNENITREEMAMMIHKAYAIKHDVEMNGSDAPFSDHQAIADAALNAVYAMKANGIISGYDDNTFKPQGTATRGEAATMMYQFINK